MTPAQALREAHVAGQQGLFEVSSHALRRMMERNVTREDIRCALRSATSATHQDVDKWRLEGGRDVDGEPLGVVAVFVDRRIIITVF